MSNDKKVLQYSDMQAMSLVEHPAQSRHAAGQAVMKRPKLAHLMALAVDLDERGLESVLNCAAFHSRYAKEA